MIRPSPDRLFERFRRTGDARALARVFDATAPEVWRVASYLCADRHAAEDAVQSAFLSAIEARADWDPSRPFVPWLLGHLGNRVREQRRAAARKPDPLRFEANAPRDPADVAAEREAAAICQDALARLAEPFRSTLERHLVGGLAAHEIAAESGVPAGTVRMRIHRGLDQLREKLPASVLAGGVVAVPLPPASLVAMREVVLGRVPGATTVVGSGHVGSFVIGALLMNKLVMGVAASAVVLLSLWLAWPANATGPNGLDGAIVVADARPAVQVAPAAAPPPSEAAPAVAVDRTAVASPSPTDTNGRLRVVLRNAGNGEPVVGARVELRDVMNTTPQPKGEASTASIVVAERPKARRDTGTDGIASFDVRAGVLAVGVDPFRITPRKVEVVAGRDTELVIELPVQVDLDVVVVDSNGAPVRDARIVAFTERDELVPAGKEIGRSDAAGCFRRPFVEAIVTVRAVVDGRAASPAVELRPGAKRTTLRVGDAAAIVGGEAFGPDGRPLANAPIAVQSLVRRNDAAPLVVRTDAAGRFEVHSVKPGPCAVFAVRYLEDGQPRVTSVEVTAVAGTRTSTEVRFGRGATIDVRLRRTDGTAVGGQMMSLRLQHPALTGSFERLGAALATSDANGEARIEGLMAGSYAAQVSLPDQLINERLMLADGETKVFAPTIGVTSGDGAITVRVVDKAQRALPGWIVKVVASSGRDQELAETDEKGTATFGRLAEPSYQVRLFAAKNSFALLEQEVAKGATVTLVAPDAAARSGVIHGKLVAGADTSLVGVGVRLMRVETGPLSREAVVSSCDPTTGSFRFEGLPPARYHLAVSAAGPQPRMLAARMNLDVGAVPVDLGVLTVGAGALRVRAMFADGRAVPATAIALGEGNLFASPPARAASDGGDGVVSDLPAGSLAVLVWSETSVAVMTTVEIRSGETTELPVTATPGARVTVHFGAGCADAPFGLLRLKQGGVETFALATTTNEPLVRGLAAGSYELEFDDMRGKRCSTSFTIGADLAPREVTLQFTK